MFWSLVLHLIYFFHSDFPPYEEMALYYPQPNQRRPLILVGPPSIGRHELRQRLLDQAEKFAAPVPRKFCLHIIFFIRLLVG